MLSPRRVTSASAIPLAILCNRLFHSRPLIRRSILYDFLPQYPTWFTNRGHTAAKIRYLHKLRSEYSLETLRECPYCGGSDFTLLATQERSGLPTRVVLCTACCLVFTNPRLSEAALVDHYQDDYRRIERGDRPDLHQFMFDLQGSKGPVLWDFITQAGATFNGDASMLDIGCGEGGLLQWFSANSNLSKVSGFELNKEAATYGLQQGLDIRQTPFTKSDDTYDLVVLEQVLEHLSSPDDLLSTIARSQTAGAWLFIGVPGLLNFSTSYDHNFIAYLQYGHMVHYCLHTLERLVTKHGYRLVRGNEIVRALFQRTENTTRILTTPPLQAAALTDLLLNSERIFSRRGSLLRNNWDHYRAYGILLFKSWLQSMVPDSQVSQSSTVKL